MKGQKIAVKTFALAIYVYGQGHRPLSVEMANGEAMFWFPPEAAVAMTEYRIHRERLSQLVTEART